MTNPVPDKIWLYRITHFSNLPHILKYGIVTAGHPHADKDFVSIGNPSLIAARHHTGVPVSPYGALGDYVPFYFGPHSPMLLQVKTGHGGIPMRPQGEIIYLISELNMIKDAGCRYCFTDGHAWDSMSEYFNDPQFLDRVDWAVVRLKYWKNTEDDIDRKRRKQAELLVHDILPVSCIHAIVVNDRERLKFARQTVENAGLAIDVHLSEGDKHFY